MPWFRERIKPVKEHNRLAGPGTVRFLSCGFPMIVEGDGWVRACRIERLPLTRRLKTVSGAYLDSEGEPLFPDQWES